MRCNCPYILCAMHGDCAACIAHNRNTGDLAHCMEAAAMAQARRLIGTGGQKLLTVDLTNEDAAKEGMVCGGTLTLLAADVTD